MKKKVTKKVTKPGVKVTEEPVKGFKPAVKNRMGAVGDLSTANVCPKCKGEIVFVKQKNGSTVVICNNHKNKVRWDLDGKGTCDYLIVTVAE